MGDTLNSLLAANRSSSVLQGIANPALVNPLAAINSGNQAASGMYNIRKLQAEQVAGQLATESIDPVTKQFDPNVYNAKIAAAGPSVAMAAQAGLQNASTLSQTQLGQQHMKVGYVQGVLGALDDNSSRDQVMSALDRGVASGMLTPTDRDNMAAHVPTDPAGMPAFIQQARLANASSMDQYHAKYGTTFRENQGGAIVGGTQAPPQQGGGISTAPGGIPLGLTQQQIDTPHTWTDASGQVHQGTLGTYLQTITGKPVVAGGGAGVPPPGASPAGVPPAGTIPPNPNAPAGTPPGRIVPPNPALANPNKPGATPPATPTVAAPTPAATQPPAATPPTPPTVGANIPGPAPGTTEDITAYKADQAAIPTQVTRAQNMQHAYDALTQLKSATGKGAQGINDLRSYAQTLGILPPGAVTEQQLMEVINKYTERAMLDAAGGTGTDLARQMQAQANPNTGLSTPANLELLRNDLGKAMQNTAAATLQDPATNGVGYLKARGDLAKNTDPRGFVWGFYSQPEQAKILAEVKGTPADDKLHRAIGMSLDPKLQIPQVRPPPVQQKQSFNAPPLSPAQNPLMMTG